MISAVMDELMTSADVARELGVGPSRVKRWADSGLLTCLRTAGRHRRFARADVERFRRAQASAGAPEVVQLESWTRRLVGDCDPYEIHSALLLERSRQGAWWRVADQLGALLAELGRRWGNGANTTVTHQMANERLNRGLARCAESLAVPLGAPAVLAASAQGDDHRLGLQLAELCFREAGWSVVWGGRGLPITELTACLDQGRCKMLAMSAAAELRDAVSLRLQAEQLGRACAQREVRLVLGGAGAWPTPSAELPPFARVHDFHELHELLAGPVRD
jgi:excisionase family DNA binding protein